MDTLAPVITIDGPAAVGKGTVARVVAAQLGFTHLDSGRFYRVIGSAALAACASLEDAAAALAAAEPLLKDQATLRAALADPQIGDERVGIAASAVARLPEVRKALMEPLRAQRRLPGLVADGRDMGTLVFPDAQLKVFLDASLAERERRAAMRADATQGAKMKSSLSDFRARNESDSNRCIAPIAPAADAQVIHTDALDADAVAREVVALFRQHQAGQEIKTNLSETQQHD
jgi:cytidylate kinase